MGLRRPGAAGGLLAQVLRVRGLTELLQTLRFRWRHRGKRPPAGVDLARPAP